MIKNRKYFPVLIYTHISLKKYCLKRTFVTKEIEIFNFNNATKIGFDIYVHKQHCTFCILFINYCSTVLGYYWSDIMGSPIKQFKKQKNFYLCIVFAQYVSPIGVLIYKVNFYSIVLD